MPYLVALLLPVTIGASRGAFDVVRNVLVSKSGVATLHIHAPGEGLWVEKGDVDRDRIVVCEVMVEEVDDA